MARAVRPQPEGNGLSPGCWLPLALAVIVHAPAGLAQEADDRLEETPAPQDTSDRPPGEEEGSSNEAADGGQGEEPAPEAKEPGATEEPTSAEPPPGYAVDRSGAPLVAVHFRSPQEGLRFFLGPSLPPSDSYGREGALRLDVSELRELCAAPCARWVYPGQYALGLAPPDDTARRAEDPLRVAEPTVVTGEYRSYGWLRAVGWATMGLSMIGGSTMIVLAFDSCDGDGLCLQDTPLSWAGAGIFFAGITGGLFLTMKEDEISFSLSPATGLSEPE